MHVDTVSDPEAEYLSEVKSSMSMGLTIVDVAERGDGWYACVETPNRTAVISTRHDTKAEALGAANDLAVERKLVRP